MKTMSVVIVLALCGLSAHGFRFVCNGLLANGEERSDECGICDEERAARWRNPEIPVVVGYETLPKTISSSDWESAVKKSFAAWNDIDGSSLKFVEKSGSLVRAFGANDSIHELFWITDIHEWRKLVGAGEFGTLGATLPRYACGGDLGDKREIFDADLVLNGLGHINWQLECDNEDCISIQTTLVHELGHFFGLDHPCQLCSTSIMSARAGYDLTYPVLDDIAGVRALYPDGSSGNFGDSCTSNLDCGERVCVNDKVNRYCSNDCEKNTECPNGTACTEIESEQVCAFVDPGSSLGKNAGDSCSKRPCREPMICAGASEESFYCYEPCFADADCKEGDMCIRLDAKDAICVTIRARGEKCNQRDLCDTNLYCIFDTLHSGTCRSPCEPTLNADSGCEDGEVCEHFAEGLEICVPMEDVMGLDDSSDGFGQRNLPGNGSRALPSASANDQKSSGCSQTGTPQSTILITMFLWGLGLYARRKR